MRLAPLLLLAAAARAQYSADDTAPVTDAPTPTSPASLAPTVAAAVIFPAADSSWSHNGTAYLKYSLPNGVSPKSVSFVLSNDNGALLKAGNSKNEELGAYFVFQKLMREYGRASSAARCERARNDTSCAAGCGHLMWENSGCVRLKLGGEARCAAMCPGQLGHQNPAVRPPRTLLVQSGRTTRAKTHC